MKRQQTERRSRVENTQKAIDKHKAIMEARGWTLEYSWCYEGVTSHINLLYKKPRTTPEPEPKVRWHRLHLKARTDSGVKNFGGIDYAVHEAVQEISCNTCQKMIKKGDHFTVRGKTKPLPVCRECCPFTAYGPREGKV